MLTEGRTSALSPLVVLPQLELHPVERARVGGAHLLDGRLVLQGRRQQVLQVSQQLDVERRDPLLRDHHLRTKVSGTPPPKHSRRWKRKANVNKRDVTFRVLEEKKT